jgi:hypothetical protein
MNGTMPDSPFSAMPPGFSLDKMAGGTLIGTWLNTLFFGMIVCEATTYYKTFGFKGDVWPIRVLVLVILTIDVLGVFACSAIGYLTFVKQYVHFGTSLWSPDLHEDLAITSPCLSRRKPSLCSCLAV